MTNKKKRRNEIHDYYLKFCSESDTGIRLEVSRLLLKNKGDVRCYNWAGWCNLLHMPLSQYAEVTENQKPIPMTVWIALYELGFNLNWFVSGQGEPFREEESNKKAILEAEFTPTNRQVAIINKASKQLEAILKNQYIK